MEQLARVTKTLTKNYVKIVLKSGQGPCLQSCSLCPANVCPALHDCDDSAVAIDPFDTRYGDVVVVMPREGRIDRRALLSYIAPAVMFFLGCYIGVRKGWPLHEWLISGLLLGIISFGISWMMNRRARLHARLRFEIVRVLKRYSEY